KCLKRPRSCQRKKNRLLMRGNVRMLMALGFLVQVIGRAGKSILASTPSHRQAPATTSNKKYPLFIPSLTWREVSLGVQKKKESGMSWHKVVILHNDQARWSAAALMRRFIMGYHEHVSTPPENAFVYHGVNETGDHVYYFSPEAST